MHDETAPGTGVRVIPGRGVIDRPAPAGSGEEVALSRVGGRSLPPSPNFPTKSNPPTARGNGNPPTTETEQT